MIRNRKFIRKKYNRGSVKSTKSMRLLYHTFPLVPKKTADWRRVINLKPLNFYLRKQNFKMDTITRVLSLVKQGDWTCIFSSADFQKAQNFLKIFISREIYQFKALCFGPTSSPRVFTNWISVIAAHLRKKV